MNEKTGVTMEKKRKHEQGFTLVSTLISLSLVLISLPLIYELLYEVKKISKLEITPYKFMLFIKEDIHRSEQLIAKDNKLYFYLSTDEVAVIEQYGDLIRRRVDNRGHEIYLRDIVKFETDNLDYGVKVTIRLKDGEKYEKVFKVD